MDANLHWEEIHATKSPQKVSWYRPHLETSLALIERYAQDRSASIIDVGGGQSTLVDDLLSRGFQNITVLDISASAIEAVKKRLDKTAERIHWLVADITDVELAAQAYDIWHDRAVFHFLTTRQQRADYVRQVARSLKSRGYVIVSTFGPQGPEKCSGLDTVRYDADSLHREFGAGFRLVESFTELHATPSGQAQQFLHCCFRME